MPPVQQTIFNRDDMVFIVLTDSRLLTKRIEKSQSAREIVKRSLSKNPNMLRTMIGTGMTLILLLSYAVYSNTVDSEYYGYTTTNDSLEMELSFEDEGTAQWYYTTNSAITWVNFSVSGALPGSELIVEAEGSNWSHSPNLGLDDSAYICNEPESDYSSIIETCEYSRIHSLVLENGSGVIRGRVSLDLPIRGKGYLESDSMANAEIEAQRLIQTESKTITWKISVETEGEVASSDGILVSATAATHELVGIEHFQLEPVQETVYSIAALTGCFFLALVIPLMIYFSATYRERRDEALRTMVDEE